VGTAFRRRGEQVSAGFHQVEVELLRSLVAQLVELLSDGQPVAAVQPDDVLAELLDLASPERPADPVVLRLFPDAYRDNDESAGDFRRYTERELRDGKLSDATTVLATLDAAARRGDKLRVRLGPGEALSWLRTLTDLRLALGTRLGVEQDDDERWEALAATDPARYVHDVYAWLGWVQETLVRAIAPR
jgi:hypothetical protein